MDNTRRNALKVSRVATKAAAKSADVLSQIAGVNSSDPGADVLTEPSEAERRMAKPFFSKSTGTLVPPPRYTESSKIFFNFGDSRMASAPPRVQN